MPSLSQCFSINRASPQASGLSVWFPTIGNSDSPLRDFVRSRNAIQYGNAKLVSDGEMKQAAFLDGDGDYWQTGSNILDFDLAYGFAISVWLRTNTLQTNGSKAVEILRASSVGYYALIQAYPTNGYLKFDSSWDSLTDNVDIRDDKWHHVVGMYAPTVVGTSGSWGLYVDGKLKASGTLAANVRGVADGSMYIGYSIDGGARLWQGGLADIRVYNRPLSLAEIWQMYASETRFDLYKFWDAEQDRSLEASLTRGVASMGGL